MTWRSFVLTTLKVPEQPDPPPGSPPRIFRAAKSFLWLKFIRFAGLQLFALAGLVTATAVLFSVPEKYERGLVTVLQYLEVVTWLFFVVQFVFNLAILRLDFELRWYMLSDRAIRVREGISTVVEKTITLANVQNISIKQGPLQRILGIADVEVRTAGGGGGKESQQHSTAEPGHVAYFRGVDNPEEIRNLLLAGVRLQKDAGLGDTDDRASRGPGGTESAIAELLDAARGLRSAAERVKSQGQQASRPETG